MLQVNLFFFVTVNMIYCEYASRFRNLTLRLSYSYQFYGIKCSKNRTIPNTNNTVE